MGWGLDLIQQAGNAGKGGVNFSVCKWLCSFEPALGLGGFVVLGVEQACPISCVWLGHLAGNRRCPRAWRNGQLQPQRMAEGFGCRVLHLMKRCWVLLFPSYFFVNFLAFLVLVPCGADPPLQRECKIAALCFPVGTEVQEDGWWELAQQLHCTVTRGPRGRIFLTGPL